MRATGTEGTRLREYRTDDTDGLVSIWRAASSLAHPFLADTFVELEAENLRSVYLPNVETWVIEHGGNPVGFIALVDDEIGGLFLDPASHGRGLGKALVDHAVALKGPLRVEVFAKNAVGRRFYDRYGFVETDRYRHDASGETTLRMAIPPPASPA